MTHLRTGKLTDAQNLELLRIKLSEFSDRHCMATLIPVLIIFITTYNDEQRYP